MNRTIVGHLLKAYKAVLKGQVLADTVGEYSDYLKHKVECQLANRCAEMIGRSVPKEGPLSLISIGGGKGELDKEILESLRRKFPKRDIKVVNVNPYIEEKDYVIPSTSATHIRLDPFTEKSKLSEEIANAVSGGATRVVLCSRSLHHTSHSIGTLRDISENLLHADATILVEHPAKGNNLYKLAHKVVYLADELIANLALFGPSPWFKSADQFVIQLFTAKDLQQHSDMSVPVSPNTRIFRLRNQKPGMKLNA